MDSVCGYLQGGRVIRGIEYGALVADFHPGSDKCRPLTVVTRCLEGDLRAKHRPVLEDQDVDEGGEIRVMRSEREILRCCTGAADERPRRAGMVRLTASP